MSQAAFYTVTGRDFFPGAAALLNSLRLLGHDEPIHVLDCGIDERQRRLLEPHAALIPAPRDAAPSTLKLVAPRSSPATVMALLDADMIVTRSLAEPLELAANGHVVAFRNDVERHFPEWGEILGLGEVRPGPYVSSGALFIDQAQGAKLLPLLDECQERVDSGRTWVDGGKESDPLFYFDQDVLNAVLHSKLPAGELRALSERLAPIVPFDGVRIVDQARLACTYRDGTEPLLLHHIARKPWLARLRSNVYSRLLTRLLFGSDVTLRLEPEDVPPWLRPGPAGRAARAAVDTSRIPAGVLRRIRGRQAPPPAWPNEPSQP